MAYAKIKEEVEMKKETSKVSKSPKLDKDCRWFWIAYKMVPSIEECPKALSELRRVNDLCQRAGGELRSRQVIATIVAEFI